MDSELCGSELQKIDILASKIQMVFQFQELASGSNSLKLLTLSLCRKPTIFEGVRQDKARDRRILQISF
jgi:hypothetical protein